MFLINSSHQGKINCCYRPHATPATNVYTCLSAKPCTIVAPYSNLSIQLPRQFQVSHLPHTPTPWDHSESIQANTWIMDLSISLWCVFCVSCSYRTNFFWRPEYHPAQILSHTQTRSDHYALSSLCLSIRFLYLRLKSRNWSSHPHGQHSRGMGHDLL